MDEISDEQLISMAKEAAKKAYEDSAKATGGRQRRNTEVEGRI